MGRLRMMLGLHLSLPIILDDLDILFKSDDRAYRYNPASGLKQGSHGRSLETQRPGSSIDGTAAPGASCDGAALRSPGACRAAASVRCGRAQLSLGDRYPHR